jgi:hypothetical protein
MQAAAKWMTFLLALVTTGCAVTPRWTATPLPFVPTAINDSGVIVGNDATNRPVSYENGTVTVLPPLGGVSGPFAAVDLASNGAILGSTGDQRFQGIFWLSGGVKIPMGAPLSGIFVPKALNVHLAVVGTAFDAEIAYKWTPNTLGYTPLKPPTTLPGAFFGTRATDINDAGSAVGYTIELSFGPVYFTRWSPDGTPIVLDQASVPFHGGPHILNNGAVYWIKGGSIIRNLGGTNTFEQPPQVHSFDAVSQVGRLAGTKTVNGVRRGWTSYQGIVTFLDLPNAPVGDFFRPVGINSCGNNIIGVQERPNRQVVGGVLFSRQLTLQCDTPPVLTQ